MSETKSFDIYSLYKRTLAAVLCSAVILIGLTLAYIFFMHPVLEIPSAGVHKIGQADSAALQTETVRAQVSQTAEGFSLFLNNNSADSDYLWIPVSDGVSSADISIENHYMDRQLWVVITGGSTEFYRDAYISGSLEGVSTAEAIEDGNRLILRFGMEG